MRRYEAMFILRPDLKESERADIFNQIKDTFSKFDTKINSANVWAEKRKLYFALSVKSKALKFKEALYYLVEFEALSSQIQNINAAYKINENILRFLITAQEQS